MAITITDFINALEAAKEQAAKEHDKGTGMVVYGGFSYRKSSVDKAINILRPLSPVNLATAITELATKMKTTASAQTGSPADRIKAYRDLNDEAQALDMVIRYLDLPKNVRDGISATIQSVQTTMREFTKTYVPTAASQKSPAATEPPVQEAASAKGSDTTEPPVQEAASAKSAEAPKPPVQEGTKAEPKPGGLREHARDKGKRYVPKYSPRADKQDESQKK